MVPVAEPLVHPDVGGPDLTDETVRPYWEGFADGELCLPHCPNCEEFHWYPAAVCPHCQSPDWVWSPVSGEATVFTWVRITDDFGMPALAETIPRYTGLVTPVEDDRIRLAAILADEPEPTIGQTVTARFRETDDGLAYPVYGPN